MSSKLSTRFEAALQYAVRIHADQIRKGSGVPYISHLLAVCSLVMEYGGNEAEATAALLHDAVEDQGGRERFAEIQAQFGEEVAQIVAGCTDAWTQPKPEWQKRKESYLAHLLEASPSVLLVSVADKLHNCRSMLSDYREVGERLWERFAGGKNGTLWYYRAMLGAYRQAGAQPRLVIELEHVVRQLEWAVENQS